MDDSELFMFGAIIAQKAQVIGCAKSTEPCHLPFNCILVRVTVPDDIGVPEASLDMSSLFIFNIVFGFDDPDKNLKEVDPLNPETIPVLGRYPLELTARVLIPVSEPLASPRKISPW